MKKIKVGDTICVFDKTLTDYYGRVGEVSEYIHPYVYVVRFKEGDEGWFMHYQIQKGASLI
jgi:hypothetical protein